MNIKIFSFIIVVLILLIIGTIFLMPEGNITEPEAGTDFSTIGTPVENAPASFVDLLTTAPSPVQQKVLDNIYLDEYYVYPCNENGDIKNVLMLVAQYKANASGENSITNAEEAVGSFEDAIYSDWGHIVYKDAYIPNLNTVSFTDEKVIDEEVWAEKYRVGTLSDNKTKIYYGWVLNYILVASSKECLLSAMKSVYEIH